MSAEIIEFPGGGGRNIDLTRLSAYTRVQVASDIIRGALEDMRRATGIDRRRVAVQNIEFKLNAAIESLDQILEAQGLLSRMSSP